MKLISSPTSPFARKVRIAVLEIGIQDRIEIVDANPWALDGVVSSHNPLGKVPALVSDDFTLIDSPVICEYLDGQHEGAKLHPEGEARWRALRLQAMGDGMMDATVLRRLETMRPAELRSSGWIERQVAAIERTLDALEGEASSLTDELTIGSITIACALGYLDFRFADSNWRASRAKLAAWFDDWAKRPAMTATAPPTSS